jgi:crotonobetainyl-CoA:carnitine CoA-transferase CaiB-like acyl-CoA transferase
MEQRAMTPLAGLTVIALEQAIAAPFCTRQLADLGARVIKIERPEGGDFARHYDTRARGLSSHFVWVNRSKESMTLDLKQPAGREILARLLEEADVLVQNLAPGAAARMGLDHASLAPTHPRLIVCDISGYGEAGPWRDRKAYDLLVQSEAGFLSITGTETELAKSGCSIVDIAAGMYGYSAILAALLERARTGQGRRIEISMLEAMTEWMGYPLYYGYDGAAPPPRAGAHHASICPYGPFRCGDGRTVLLAVQNEREWRSFCSVVLGEAALAEDPRFNGNAQRLAHRHELQQRIEARFASLSADQLMALLEEARIAYGQVNTVADLWAHPQLAARGRWREIDSPAGPLRSWLPPGLTEARMDPVPALGEHTEAILAGLGYSGEAIATLRREGVI